MSSIITMLSSLLSTNMTVAQLLWRTIYLYLDCRTVAKYRPTPAVPLERHPESPFSCPLPSATVSASSPGISFIIIDLSFHLNTFSNFACNWQMLMVFLFVVFILFDHPWIAERSRQRPGLRGQEIAEEVFFTHCTSKFLDSSKMDRPK